MSFEKKIGSVTKNFVLKALSEESDKYLAAKRAQDISKRGRLVFILKPLQSLGHISDAELGERLLVDNQLIKKVGTSRVEDSQDILAQIVREIGESQERENIFTC